MRDVEAQQLMDEADKLRANGQYKESIKRYLDVLRLMKTERKNGNADELWCKKVICMTCNGMGISYAKLGIVIDAIDNFQDAVLYAPTEEAKRIAKSNLDKYQKAIKDKTGVEFVSHFID